MLKKIILLAIFSLAIFMPAFASAQGLKNASGFLDQAADTSKTGLSSDLAGTVASVIKAILALVGTAFLVLTIYAGVLWMTAQGNEEQVTKAVGIIKASIIGLIIIMSAYAITYFVTSKLSGSLQSSQQAPQSGPNGCCYYSGGASCQNGFTESECGEYPGRVDWQIGTCPAVCLPSSG